MAAKKQSTDVTAGNVVRDAGAVSRAAWRQAQGIVVDESEPAKPKDAKIVDLPTGARSHPG